MSFSRGCAALIALLTAGFLVAGCGETVVDDVKTEGAIEKNVEGTLGMKVKSVDCPSDVEVKKDTKFDCTVVLDDGKEQTATLKILNEDADVEFMDLSPSK